MPIYVYSCKNLGCECDTFETHESIKADPLTICPYCGSNTVARVPQIPMYIKTTEIKTVGQLAELNAKKMGKYGLELKEKELAESKRRANEFVGSLPAGASLTDKTKARQVDTSLAKMTPAQTTKYILTGKKPIGLR